MKDKNIKEEVLKEEVNKEVNEEIKNEKEKVKEEKEEAHEHEHKHGEHTCCGKHGHKHEEEIGKLKAEIEEWKNEYLRKQADFQNFTKRKEKEVDELKKFASEKIITQFLGSLDNFERAIESSIESKDFDSLLKGIEMIVRNLKDIMSAEGVEEIKTEGVYDPVYHHAVGVEASEDKKEDEIVKVLQKGYMMKGKVIRPAMVIVCKK
ncbi:nucleotide exchange factor GrpE [Fusobacterium canifelinum]|uniref:Protein GrpE n=1 Tax=Fusobacterium canifelinum TaxID=285729 RepID=A0A3P1UZE6_9FUSO|nr:nucleotide exchange factor GrpE [Fusobacterium canifelinum]RRD27202.1 nucleotide exchange factor GrpE [Fusobacterium canifelinum]